MPSENNDKEQHMQTLRVHRDKRHLTTADGERFYLIGDTAWELFHALDREEASFYLRTRQSQGYNMIQAVVLAELDGLEMGKIAVISALRDNVRPRTTHRGSSLKLESGSTWLDREYMAWFDPAGEDTLACLLATVRACEAAGFEQVVLEDFSYPTAGKLDLITMPDSADRVQALTQLANQLRDGTDLALGLVLTPEAAASLTDPVSGQDVAALAPFFDRMYAPGGFDADLSPLDSAVEGTQCEIGLYVRASGQAPADFDRNFIQIP